MSETPASGLAVLGAFTEALARFDYETAFAHVAEDCEYRNMIQPEVVHVGPAAARAVLEPFFGATVENEFLLIRAVENGPVVIAERLDRHRLKDGRWVELPVTGVYEVHQGKITVWRDYFDGPSIYSKWPAALPGA